MLQSAASTLELGSFMQTC